MTTTMNWYATCPRGLEGLLLEELRSLGMESPRETVGGVHFQGGRGSAYRACLWSRLANRILHPVTEFAVGDSDSLYRGIAAVDWRSYLTRESSLRVDFSGTSDEIRNTRYGAQVCKDAIVDQLEALSWPRPDVARHDPDLRLNVRLGKHKIVVAVDYSGASLHQRGYRLEAGLAPLKENLAAALLLRADWPGIAAAGGALIDPMCGSGTLLLEGALMVADIAPGLARQRWGFEKLPDHDDKLWQSLLADAAERAERGRNRQLPEIRGYDADAATLRRAQANIERAGLAKVVRVTRKSLAELKKPTHRELDRGLVIVNPPYGERLGERDSLRYLYRELGDVLSREFSGWEAAIFTSDKELGLATRLRSRKRYALFNGTLPSQLLLFTLDESSLRPPPAAADADPGAPAGTVPALTDNAQMFANRLHKNQRRLDKWLRREGISCYRLYDADMPEYAVAVDRYGDYLHVAEYKAPKGVEPAAAERRLEEVAAALPVATGIAPERIFFKQRQRQRGTQQYQRVETRGELHTVMEGGVKLLVNFSDYLDTGLFLDHRPLRLQIAAEARAKDFLNLFCYTATASVHACAGGARSTTSVDLSRTYTDWARKNMAVNGFAESDNHIIQADCLKWMAEAERCRYDLILLDPPSFSNSKRMEQSLDVQRDQLSMLRAAMALLRPGGVLYFSNNLRSFELAAEVADFCAVENITRQTLDQDFQRGRGGHQCWRLQHRTESC